MKYMILMSGSQKDTQAFLASMTHEDVKRHVDFMGKLNQDLRARGELVDAQGLTGPEQAKIVRARPGGSPVVTDGPFPESKEFLAGYWLVDVSGPERIIELAALISAAPGRGGEPLNFPVEVRAIGVAPA
jgi:hypothetical protein